MEIKDILSKVDHTILNTEATWDDVKAACDDAIEFGCASICVYPKFVKQVKEYVQDKIKISTVIGFPEGTMPLIDKKREINTATLDGADEFDCVIDVRLLKQGKYDVLLNEINEFEAATRGKIVKVIIETCLLTDDEKIKMCEIVDNSTAHYIKTSTGFSTGGATKEDVKLLVEHAGPYTKIKASGGINTLEEAEEFINLGASRIGSSKIVKSLKK